LQQNNSAQFDVTLYSRVKSFIEDQTNVRSDELSPDTRIYHDLGVTGDDADEFLEAFRREFGVDMANFNFDDHFTPELSAFAPLSPFFWLFMLTPTYRKMMKRPRDAKRKFMVIPVTVMDLVKAAKEGNWLDLSDRERCSS
jgi:acyl carrier protein